MIKIGETEKNRIKIRPLLKLVTSWRMSSTVKKESIKLNPLFDMTNKFKV
jgi:hypothetical protein